MIRTIVCLVLCSAMVSAAHGQKLKIDYSSYLGGAGGERGYAIATDSNGAIYLAGFTQSWDFPVLNALQPYFGGGTGDLFVAKLKADASGFEYVTYLGGSGGDGELDGYVGGMAVDKQGNVYVAGVTGSADFPTTAGSYQTSIGSQFECDDDPNAGLCGDAFVVKLSCSGTLVYSTFLGGSDYDAAKGIAVDSTGAAYITGVTTSPDFPTTTNAFRSQPGDVDAFVAKIRADGKQLLYSVVIGGTGADAGMAMAVDGNGRAHIGGLTQAADFPLRNALQSTFGDPWDAFVLRLNAQGTDLEFSTLLGGRETDEALGIAIGPHGDIYVAGYTDSADFPVKNAFQAKLAASQGNGFVTKIAATGTAIVYSTFLGGADGTSLLNAVAVDSQGNAYVAGFGGSDFPIVSSTQAYKGGSDAVIAKLTADGSGVIYSTFIGGSSLDVTSAIALDASERIVITGQTASPDFPTSSNGFQRHPAGGTDAFVFRLQETSAGGPIFSSPKLIAINAMYVGRTSAAVPLLVTNLGNSTLAISGMNSSGNVQIGSDCGLVAPGKTCSIYAQMSPAAAGDQFGTIEVYDNAPDSPQTIFVRGSAVYGGDLELSSVVTGLSFNYYGETAIPLTATIVNHGPNDSEDVMMRVRSESGSASCDPCYVGRIRAGNSAIVRFDFVPSTYGMLPLSVHVQASDASPDLNATNDAKSVTIANPRYQPDLQDVSFSDQTVNLNSEPQRITFVALDGQPLQLTFANTGDFNVSGACDTATLSCYAEVLFTPAAAGMRKGTLIVSEPLAGTRQEIPLSGVGVLAPHLELSESALMFVDGVTGMPGTPHAITLTNDGSAPLLLVAITIDGDFVQTNQCPASLMPGKICTVFVSFVTAYAGVSGGNLTIVHNGSTMLNNVSLTGTGVPPANLARPGRPTSGEHTTALVARVPNSTVLDRPVRGEPPRPTTVRPLRRK